MADEPAKYDRYCPGEQQIKISEAVCIGRRKANFRKCPGCQFNDDEKAARAAAARVMPAIGDARMIEKCFKAYDVRATYPDPLNEDVAWRIGNGTAQFLRTLLSGYDRSDSRANTLIVGRDMRKSSPSLQNAFIEGAIAVGTPIIDIGMIDTSQIYFAANHLQCCGGAQTTASHNPSNYNGFKISGPKGKPIGAESGLKEIERIAKAISRHRVPELTNLRTVDLAEPYRNYLLKFLHEPRPLKVVVDASNGMAGKWFPIVFGGVPNLTVARLNFEHDGEFVHQPNPLVEANLEQLRAMVRDTGADFGACFDGDADRCVFIDEHAKIVKCDLLTALLAREYLRGNSGATVIFDLRSSRVVAETVKAAGGVPRRERVGHVFMKKAMSEAGGVFGGELSGHFYFRDYFNCDSGFLTFIAVVNVLSRTGMKLSELLAPFEKYASSGERNFVNEDKLGTFSRIKDKYRDAQIDELDGVTVQYPEWWFNIRGSNTEPLLRLNMEANSPELLAEKLAALTPMLGQPAIEH